MGASFNIGAPNQFIVHTNGSQRAAIDASGRLLIGTSSSTSTSAFVIQGYANTPAGAVEISITRGGTPSATDQALGTVRFQNNSGNTGAQIDAFSDGAWVAGSDYASKLTFSTTAAGASTPTERMRIGSTGGFKVSNTGTYNLGANVHEINSNVGGSAAFHAFHSSATTPLGYYCKFTGANPNDTASYVFGSFDNTNANIYTIYSNGTVGARSDAKFKKNIETARNGYLADLAQLRVVKFNWHNHADGTPKDLGFIAQDVEKVFPGLVATVPDKDNHGNETGEVSKSVKTSVFTPMLVKALQEALGRIEALEAKVAALETP